MAPREKSSAFTSPPRWLKGERGISTEERLVRSHTLQPKKCPQLSCHPTVAPTSKLGETNQMVSGESRLASGAQRCGCSWEGSRREEGVSGWGCSQRLFPAVVPGGWCR